jgi:hypothetical protein
VSRRFPESPKQRQSAVQAFGSSYGMRVFLKAAHVGRRVVKVLLLSCHYEHVQASASASADRE